MSWKRAWKLRLLCGPRDHDATRFERLAQRFERRARRYSGNASRRICVIDYRPRQLDESQQTTLLELAAIASDAVKLRQVA